MLTVAQVAQQLGLKEPTVRAWIARGRISYVKFGRAVRVPADEVRRLIEENLKPASK